MEELNQPIRSSNLQPSAIVSTMTTVNENGTSVTQITSQTIDEFEPDPKWEMTTLEKASFEPATTEEQQEDNDYNSLMLNQGTEDTQMEKVIDNIVELGGCQQYVQTLEHGNILDKEKEVKDIEREISGAQTSSDACDQPMQEPTIEIARQEAASSGCQAASVDTENDPKTLIDTETVTELESEKEEQPEKELDTNIKKETSIECEPRIETILGSKEESKLDTKSENPCIQTSSESCDHPEQEHTIEQSQQETNESGCLAASIEADNDLKTSIDLQLVTELKPEKEEIPKEQVDTNTKESTSSDIETQPEAVLDSESNLKLEMINEIPIAQTSSDSSDQLQQEPIVDSEEVSKNVDPANSTSIGNDQKLTIDTQTVKHQELETEELSKEKVITKLDEENVVFEPELEDITLKSEAMLEQSDKTDQVEEGKEGKKRDQVEEPERQVISHEEPEPTPEKEILPKIETRPRRASKRSLEKEFVAEAKIQEPTQKNLKTTTRRVAARSTIATSAPSTKPVPQKKLDVTLDDDYMSKKFKCHDCGYSTERLNNIVYHKKNSCQHFQRSWNKSVENYISGLVKSPKSNRKRTSR